MWRGRGGTLLFPLYSLPRDDGAMIDLAPLLLRRDAERLHEVPHIEPVGAADPDALLRRQPDFFLGDRRHGGERGEKHGRGGRRGRNGQGGRIGHGGIVSES